MMSSNVQETGNVSQVKQENDWEEVDYGPGEQETVSDPDNDPLNYVGPNSTYNAEKDISAKPVLKKENPEQENDTVSPYFMSEVTDDTTTEEGGNDNEETETIIVAPEWSWEAMHDTSDDSDNDNTEAHHNSTREDVFIDIDNNGILPSDSDSVDNDDDDDDDYRVKSGKKKKRKKSPDKNKSVKFADVNYEELINSVKRKYKKSPDMNKVKKIKLTATEYAKHGSNKLEILNNPEDIYIPDGWSRRVFQRLSGKYPGKLDVLYIDPNGKKFKSKIDIIRYFCENNIKSEVDVKAMCFGYGRPGFLPVFPEGYKAPEISSITKAPQKSNNLPPKSNNLPPKSNNLPLTKTQKTSQKHSKISNQEKYKKEISSHISEVSTLCERLSVKDVTVEYSKEDFVNLTNHQVYTEYISAMLEAENPEVPASDISEIAEAKWKHFLVVKESKTATKEDKVSQELIEFLQEDDYEEPEDERDEDYKDDDAESNDSHDDYATNPRKVKKSFKCPCCVVICYSIDLLGKHMKIHENEESVNIDDNPYGCPHCSEKLDSIENLFCHVETHGIIVNNKQQGSLFSCIYCIKKCSTLANLKLHVNSHLKCRDEDGNVVMYSCPVCHNRFTKILDLQKHINKVHNESVLFACPHCPMKCTKIQNLNGHIRARHSEDGKNKLPDNKYKCIHCEYTTHRRERLAIHIRVHTGEKPFKCNVCDHATSSYSNLKLHELIHNDTKRYQCSFCEYRCNQRNSLKTHERMHTDDRPFLCSECGHRCLTKNNLNLHMKNHVEGSECVCSVCGMKFLHTNSLKSHMANVHSYQSNSTQKFACLQCNYMATTKGNLKVHMRVHTGDRHFECPECGKKFTQGGSLKIHIRKHTGEKPFGCRICDYRCTTKGNLLKHMIKHGGYTNKDIFEEKVEKCDNEEYSESNCKKILSDIMKSGSNLQIDQTDEEIQEDSQDVEIINDTSEQKPSDVMPSKLENIKKLNNSNNIDLTNKYNQTDFELGQANYCEPQQSYNNLPETNFPGENEGIQSYEKKTEDEEQHFLSGLFQ